MLWHKHGIFVHINKLECVCMRMLSPYTQHKLVDSVCVSSHLARALLNFGQGSNWVFAYDFDDMETALQNKPVIYCNKLYTR